MINFNVTFLRYAPRLCYRKKSFYSMCWPGFSGAVFHGLHKNICDEFVRVVVLTQVKAITGCIWPVMGLGDFVGE